MEIDERWLEEIENGEGAAYNKLAHTKWESVESWGVDEDDLEWVCGLVGVGDE